MREKQITITSERLYELMAENKLRAIDLVKKTGIDKGNISHYLAGRSYPNLENAKKLGAVLNASPAYINGYSDYRDYREEARSMGYTLTVGEMTIEAEHFYRDYEKLSEDQKNRLASYMRFMMQEDK